MREMFTKWKCKNWIALLLMMLITILILFSIIYIFYSITILTSITRACLEVLEVRAHCESCYNHWLRVSLMTRTCQSTQTHLKCTRLGLIKRNQKRELQGTNVYHCCWLVVIELFEVIVKVWFVAQVQRQKWRENLNGSCKLVRNPHSVLSVFNLQSFFTYAEKSIRLKNS